MNIQRPALSNSFNNRIFKMSYFFADYTMEKTVFQSFLYDDK